MQEIGRKPTNKEAVSFVKQYIAENYYDSNVKNIRVKEPVYTKIMVGKFLPYPQKGWAICYQSNAKNLYGAYTGLKRRSIGVQNMRLKPQGQAQLGWSYCGKAEWIK